MYCPHLCIHDGKFEKQKYYSANKKGEDFGHGQKHVWEHINWQGQTIRKTTNKIHAETSITNSTK